ncbi:aspartate/glutamate racemase family protein [Salsuginibacillus kocurii]|uniref:aspartate/glutamate racemase family protein n=1 Tax=Salsuginibacillus kocurii TaxID=427078 RepID=UPI00037FF485|nr:aspartate/glutamate racemase family protein [Salsuginibacillus kocurii]
MRIACIHALKSSLAPIDRAFLTTDPSIELIHMMDTSLLQLLREEKQITPLIRSRLASFCTQADALDVQAVQMTCSAFNGVRDDIQPFVNAPVFRSDEGVMDEASRYIKIGLIATVEETPPPLLSYLQAIAPSIEVTVKIDTTAMTALQKGEPARHDRKIKDLMQELAEDHEAIVLSQYSMAHVADQLHLPNTDILTAPQASVTKCLKTLSRR